MRRVSLLLAACMVWSGVSLASEVSVGGVHFVFLEPDPGSPAGDVPVYRKVTDPERLNRLGRWLENDSARWAADVYRRARNIAVGRGLGTLRVGGFI